MIGPNPNQTHYCDLADHPVHGPYHDRVYGFPVIDDNGLFRRLILEINQAGLSWLIVLKKEKALYQAFADGSIDAVAKFVEHDIERLCQDKGIIRNRRKIMAVIENARRIKILQGDYGSWQAWLNQHAEYKLDQWVKLFRRHLVFTGPEVTREFLFSTSYLAGAHRSDCPVYRRLLSHPGVIWRQSLPLAK